MPISSDFILCRNCNLYVRVIDPFNDSNPLQLITAILNKFYYM